MQIRRRDVDYLMGLLRNLRLCVCVGLGIDLADCAVLLDERINIGTNNSIYALSTPTDEMY